MVVYNNPLVGQFNQKRPSRHRWDCGRDDGHTKTAKPKKIRYITQSSRPIKSKCLCPSAAGRTPSARDPTPRRGWYFPRWFTRKVVVDVVVDYNNRHVNPQRPNTKKIDVVPWNNPEFCKMFPAMYSGGDHLADNRRPPCISPNRCEMFRLKRVYTGGCWAKEKKPFFVIK
jgi:hypothetical protein